jgi:hypothetical protein
VRIDRASARPGGTAMLLDETGFAARAGEPLELPVSAGLYRDGMHTLSSGGGVTLIDVKHIDRSLAGLWLDFRRTLGRSFA